MASDELFCLPLPIHTQGAFAWRSGHAIAALTETKGLSLAAKLSNKESKVPPVAERTPQRSNAVVTGVSRAAVDHWVGARCGQFCKLEGKFGTSMYERKHKNWLESKKYYRYDPLWFK